MLLGVFFDGRAIHKQPEIKLPYCAHKIEKTLIHTSASSFYVKKFRPDLRYVVQVTRFGCFTERLCSMNA